MHRDPSHTSQETYFLSATKMKSVTVVEGSEADVAFAPSEAGIVGSNPTQGMDVWFVHVLILCLSFPVFR